MRRGGFLLLASLATACGARSGVGEEVEVPVEEGGLPGRDATSPADQSAPARDATTVDQAAPARDASEPDASTMADGAPPPDVAVDDAPLVACGSSPTWQRAAPTGAAAAVRATPAAIEDEANGRMVLFGGQTTVMGVLYSLGDTWALAPDGSLQRLVNEPDPAPPARGYASAILDADRRQLVLFGGFATTGFADVWSFPLGTGGLLAGGPWSPLASAGPPPSPRYGHCAVYDARNQRMIVFGGTEAATGLPDDGVWSLSLPSPATWARLAPVGAGPAARVFASCVYDEERQRMIVFGGDGALGAGPPFGDLWELSLSGPPTWSPMVPSGVTPGARTGHSAVLDASCGRMIVFGGETAVSPFVANDVWSLSLSGAPVWTQLAPQGTPPAPRLYQAGVRNARTRQMTIFGGLTRQTSPPWLITNDAWWLGGL